MASWIMHIRVSELVNAQFGFKSPDFYIGSVAPDSGKMFSQTEYLPPKHITHWSRYADDRLESNRLFYEKYAKNEQDEAKRAFYMGYYGHILTDTFFIDEILHPLIRANRELWASDPWAIKGDWFSHDCGFLCENPEYKPYSEFLTVTQYENNGLLDYFSKDDITERLLFIRDYYQTHLHDTRQCKFLTREQYESFINNTAIRINNIFSCCD